MPDDLPPTADADSIATALRDRMRNGTYRPGQRLTEMDLAEEFDIGRHKIREIFQKLVGEGYLEFVANRGVLVRRYSRAEILDMGRVREMLEGLAARMAAEKALTADDCARLEAHQQALDRHEAAGEIAAYDAENSRYHATIWALSGNGPVVEALARVRLPLFRVQLPSSFSTDSLSASNADHRVITMAILNRHPDAAEAAMRSHIRVGNAHIATLPESVFAPPKGHRPR